VLADHTARCWGADDSGQLGDGGTTASPRAVAVVAPGTSTPLADVREVVAGRAHACARLGDASVVCWGANESGQLGSLGGLPLAARVFAGSNGTCALDDGASAQCWGASDVGQLGNGNTTTGPMPFPIATTSGTDTLYPIGAIGLGARHGCARVTDGRVLCWGARDRVGVDLEDLTFIDHPAQRTVVRDTTALGVGPQHSCAVVMPGTTVQCWGSNSAGQLGDGTTTDRSSPTLVVW
jgi:alpha-tubulin suppressor-like RCC1 family protein